MNNTVKTNMKLYSRSKSSKKSKKEPEVLPMYDRALKVENLEDFGRTNSRDNLLPGGAKKRSWRRNHVNSSFDPSWSIDNDTYVIIEGDK